MLKNGVIIKNNYQEEYSKIQPKMFEIEGRIQKAKKVISVVKDFSGNIDDKNLLDIGCSTGIMTKHYSKYFKEIDGIDIDDGGVAFAKDNNSSKNITYSVSPIEEF